MRPDEYYASFAYHISMNTKTKKTDIPVPDITHIDYFQKKKSLNAYKLPELKRLAQHHGLHVSGNKSVVIDRIHDHFLYIQSCEMIQKRFRGHIVRYWFKLRGPAYKDRSICVNDSDFYTMDPLSEIPNEYFFSYRDDKTFVYGFDITSMLKLFQKSKQINNPYNREKISIPLAKQMISFYSISRMLFHNDHTDYSLNHSISVAAKPTVPPPARPRRAVYRRQHPPAVQEIIHENRFLEESEPVFPIQSPPTSNPEDEDTPSDDRVEEPRGEPRPVAMSTTNRHSREMDSLHLLEQLRMKPIDVRVRELFMEIDQLGNYTSHQWFLELSKLGYAQMYENLFIWWNVRNHIPPDVKRSICGISDPFPEIQLIRRYTTVSIDKFRELALATMEAFVYTGINDEFRKLGAMHVLTILTTVCIPARRQLPWLFESLPHYAFHG